MSFACITLCARPAMLIGPTRTLRAHNFQTLSRVAPISATHLDGDELLGGVWPLQYCLEHCALRAEGVHNGLHRWFEVAGSLLAVFHEVCAASIPRHSSKPLRR